MPRVNAIAPSPAHPDGDANLRGDRPFLNQTRLCQQTTVPQNLSFAAIVLAVWPLWLKNVDH